MINRRGTKIDRRVPGLPEGQGAVRPQSVKVREAEKYWRDMKASGDVMLERFARKELDKVLAQVNHVRERRGQLRFA